MLGLDGIHRASSSRIGPKASARSRRLTTIGLSRRFLAGSNAAADNYRIGNARSSFHGELSRTRVQLPPPPPLLNCSLQSTACCHQENRLSALRAAPRATQFGHGIIPHRLTRVPPSQK